MYCFHQGLPIETSTGPLRARIFIPGFVSDLPATTHLRNSITYNGYHACSLCEIRGESVESGRGHCMAFKSQAEAAVHRTHQSVSSYAEQASLTSTTV